MNLITGFIDRHSRKRPFSSWMKRLANLKNSSTTTSSAPQASEKKHHHHVPNISKAKKHWNGKNNPYPESGHLHKPPAPSVTSGGEASSFSPGSDRVGSFASYDSLNNNIPHRSNKSTAPTLATNAETVNSDAGQSKAGTSATNGGFYEGRANSTFSSPENSQESLTTTLTTIQSTAPSGMLTNGNAAAATQSPVHFSHQYPISPPASAVPTHLQPLPHTYVAATANNMLSDDASIMTLASSSKRRRRHSLDTDASVRALAPSSLFGNSRESLPLSVLSSNVNIDNTSAMSSSQNRPGGPSGLASAERASVYSATGVGAPALISERNSYYSAKQGMDGASVRSGFLGHSKTESINGSITGLAANSPLASPRDAEMPGRSSRRTSEWKDGDEKSMKEDIEDGGHDIDMPDRPAKDN
jgi:hypothetical protein